MPKNKISEFSSTAANNTDIAGINIAEGCAPSGINNAIRELMAQLKDQQAGTDSDNFVVGGNLSVTGTSTFTGIPSAPTAAFSTNTTQVATTAFVQAALAAAYPVGSIYINATSSTNPATLLGFGTWVAFGAGRVPVGLDAGNAAFDTAEETGGSADAITVSHTHTATSVVTDPGHAHSIIIGEGFSTGNSVQYTNSNLGTRNVINSNTTGITVATTNASAGSSGTNANLPPYIVVRMWKRTV
jgi:hypothetical protein